MFVGLQVVEVVCDSKLRVDFQERASRLSEKVAELSGGQPSLPLRDIRHDGDSSPPDLRGQAVCLILGEGFRDAIDSNSESFRLLPNQEFAIGASHLAV